MNSASVRKDNGYIAIPSVFKSCVFERVQVVEVPVYFIMGRHDKIVHDTVSALIGTLKAPCKVLEVFE